MPYVSIWSHILKILTCSVLMYQMFSQKTDNKTKSEEVFLFDQNFHFEYLRVFLCQINWNIFSAAKSAWAPLQGIPSRDDIVAVRKIFMEHLFSPCFSICCHFGRNTNAWGGPCAAGCCKRKTGFRITTSMTQLIITISRHFPISFMTKKLGSTLFEKSNFCPKIQVWQDHNIFTSFSPNFFWQFFSWNQSCQQLKSPKPQHFHEFFTQIKSTIFSGNQSWIFGQKMKISNSVK